MKADGLIQILLEIDLSAADHEGVPGQKVTNLADGTCCSQPFCLVGEQDWRYLLTFGSHVLDGSFNGMREMMGIDHDLLKTGACQEFPRIMDQRAIQERNGRLGTKIGQRVEPRSQTRCQNHPFHRFQPSSSRFQLSSSKFQVSDLECWILNFR